MNGERVCIVGMADNVHVQRWAAALIERGLRVSLISTVPLTRPLPPMLRHVPRYVIPTASASMSARQRLITLLQGWARVPGVIAALRPDVVHLHALPTPAAAPFLRCVPRLVVSAWGSDVVQRDRRKAQLYPWLLDHAAQITATSRYLADVTASYLRRPRPIHVVPFGVDTARFGAAAGPLSQNRIGTLRHLESIYGIDVLIAALPEIVQQAPDVQLVIGGAGSGRAALEAQARSLHVADRVQFVGRVLHENVPDLLRSLNVFVLPSRAEAFGVAAIEAQACGVPVVASEVGGVPEVVQHGVTGLLVPPGDPAALAQAITTLLHDTSRRLQMGAAARIFVQDRYEWQRNVDQMLAVYAQVGR